MNSRVNSSLNTSSYFIGKTKLFSRAIASASSLNHAPSLPPFPPVYICPSYAASCRRRPIRLPASNRSESPLTVTPTFTGSRSSPTSRQPSSHGAPAPARFRNNTSRFPSPSSSFRRRPPRACTRGCSSRLRASPPPASGRASGRTAKARPPGARARSSTACGRRRSRHSPNPCAKDRNGDATDSGLTSP